MSTTQLSFAIRTSATKTVQLLGSWDNYTSQLPLQKDSSKPGTWKATFRFQSATLKPGQRYWYYYIIDGYHVSHDPSREYTVEPTTSRKLNILDVPSATKTVTSSSSKRHSRRMSRDIAKGRALSPSRIVAPKPVKPNQTRAITTANYDAVQQLSSRLDATTLNDEDSESDSDFDSDSDAASDAPSMASTRSTASRASSVSSTSSSCCTCERYGITRAGDRVKLDCGGSRCGSSDDSCSSESEEEIESPVGRRNGIVVRS